MPKKLLSVLLLIVGFNSCVSIPNVESCSSIDSLARGAFCAGSLDGNTREMTMEEYIEFLEPQPKRPDPLHLGEFLPARAGAVAQSAQDFNRIKTALEQACKKLGAGCTYEHKQVIKSLKKLSNKLRLQ